jgi:hypothetical protein
MSTWVNYMNTLLLHFSERACVHEKQIHNKIPVFAY